MTCKRGHEYRGDENYRAREGKCPVCLREAQQRYDRTEKGRARHRTYEHSEMGELRHARYVQSPKGWKNALNSRRAKALKRRKQRKEAEDSNG